MSFEKFTTCPICNAHAPCYLRQERDKMIIEHRSCPVHGVLLFKVEPRSGVRKLLSYGQPVDTRKPLSPRGSFMDRCEKWAELRFQGSVGIRRIPPKRR